MLESLEKALKTSLMFAKQQSECEEQKNTEIKESIKHNQRSKLWISYLAKQLLTMEQTNKQTHNLVSFFRNNTDVETRQIFNLNEFLFDIVIANMCELNSANEKKKITLKAIKNAEWIVESEFQANNSRALLLDINKLVIAKAKNKLFIMSLNHTETMKAWVIQTIRTLMDCENENIYLAIVPHPKDWKTKHDIEVLKIT